MPADETAQLAELFAVRLNSLRSDQGLSIDSLAATAGIPVTRVRELELGSDDILISEVQHIAKALDVPLVSLFDEPMDPELLEYRVNPDFSISCGFLVSSETIRRALISTATDLSALPFALFNSIDLKATSGIAGAVFAGHIAEEAGALVNPIEKGHPDIVPADARGATEEQLRNYPDGLEIKTTVGGVPAGSELASGMPRYELLSSITWQAHHRDVHSLMGTVIDFVGKPGDDGSWPIISGVFFSEDLEPDDWGKIAGTTGRNTKVTGMKASGKAKMGAGWVAVLDREDVVLKYQGILKFNC